MVPIKYFFYDQTSAPQITGELGKLDAILYACLVTGYNTRNISSIAVSNNVATVTTSTTHGYNQYDIIKISGANESVFNDEFTIASVPTTTTFTFAVTTGLSSASGTITCKIAPLGWTREFTGTNKSVYRSPDVTGTRLYLRVDDSLSANYTQVNIYETMSSVDAGTGKSTDIFWFKSNTANTVTHPWYLIGDSKRFYFITTYHATYPGNAVYAFGDLIPSRTGDAWCCMLAGCSNSANYISTPDTNASFQNTNGVTTGNILARNYTGLGASAPFLMFSAMRWTTIGYSASPTTQPFPSPNDNAVHLTPIYLFDYGLSTYTLRGTVPGMTSPLESVQGAYANKDRSVIYNGRTYMAFKSSYGTSSGNLWFDITGPWT